MPQGNVSRLDAPAFKEALYTGQYEVFKTDNRPFEGYVYEIRSDVTGKVLASGKTDASGYTNPVTTPISEPISAYKSIMRESERITENWQGKLNAAAANVKP